MKTPICFLLTLTCLLISATVQAQGLAPVNSPFGSPSSALGENNLWNSTNHETSRLDRLYIPAPEPSERGFFASVKAGVLAPLGLANQIYQDGVSKGWGEFWHDNWGRRTNGDCIGFLFGCVACAMLVQKVRDDLF